MLKRYSLKVYGDVKLINSSKYTLNVTTCFYDHIKYIEVGYSFAFDTLQPIVKIACFCCSMHGELIYLTKDDWFKFIELESFINKFFGDTQEMGNNNESHNAHDTEIFFMKRNEEKCISLSVRAEEIFLNKHEWQQLVQFKELIGYKLKLHATQKFHEYYTGTIKMIAPHIFYRSEYEVNELLNQILHFLDLCKIDSSLNYFCLLEILQFYPQKLANDVRELLEEQEEG